MAPENLKTHYYAPSDVLKPFLKAFVIIESDRATQNRLLPDTSIVLAFRLRGRVDDHSPGAANSLPGAVITGLRKSVRFLSYDDHTANLLVLFKDGGAATLFREPLNEFFGKSVSLDNLMPGSLLQLIEEQLSEANSGPERVSIVEHFLISRLNTKRTDQMINYAIQQIRLANGNIRIKGLARDMAISIDPFEKRFRRVTGISPKQFADTVRLRTSINQYSPTDSFTELALKAGYFDQAHFIKDFRTFTGMPPQQFFKSASWW